MPAVREEGGLKMSNPYDDEAFTERLREIETTLIVCGICHYAKPHTDREKRRNCLDLRAKIPVERLHGRAILDLRQNPLDEFGGD